MQRKNIFFNLKSNIFIYYFIVPIVLGVFLTQVLNIDISDAAKKYVGLFYYFDKSGVDVNSKAMIVIISLFFIPLLWKYCRSLPINIDNLKAMTVLKLFAVVGLSILMIISFFVFLFTHISYDSLSYKTRGVRVLLSVSHSDILFGMLFLLVLFVVIYFVNVAIIFMSELGGRIKNNINN